MRQADWLFAPDDPVGRLVLEVQRLTTLWVEATREHGEFNRCPSLVALRADWNEKYQSYVPPCDICRAHYKDGLYLYSITKLLNSYGEEVDRSAPASGFAFRP